MKDTDMTTGPMNREIETYVDSIAKRVYPLTEKEKNCIQKYGEMVINRGHVKKAIIETISKYEPKAEAQILDSGNEQETQNS